MPAFAPAVIEDPESLRELLCQDRATTAYMLGDLGPSYARFARWYGAGLRETRESILLVYTGMRLPTLISFGQSGPLGGILDSFADEMPDRVNMHIQPHHLAALDRHYDSEGLRPVMRMALQAASFAPAQVLAGEVIQLSHRDTADIMELYVHHPENFFEPAQIHSGHYYGVRVDERLVSIAGVHAINVSCGVAVLGNIVTHPDYRRRGLSTACTSVLCEKLMGEGIVTIALNVARGNRSAVRVYEKLGFRYHDTYLEGEGTRRQVGTDR